MECLIDNSVAKCKFVKEGYTSFFSFLSFFFFLTSQQVLLWFGSITSEYCMKLTSTCHLKTTWRHLVFHLDIITHYANQAEGRAGGWHEINCQAQVLINEHFFIDSLNLGSWKKYAWLWWIRDPSVVFCRSLSVWLNNHIPFL